MIVCISLVLRRTVAGSRDEPRRNSRSCCIIVLVGVVLKRTVVDSSG